MNPPTDLQGTPPLPPPASESSQKKIKLKSGSPVILRPSVDGDLHFVLDSWLRSLLADSPWQYKAGVRGSHPRQHFRISGPTHRTGADKFLKSILPKINVACITNLTDLDHVLSWVASHEFEGETVLDFMYVKNSFRRFGLGGAMLEHLYGADWRRVSGSDVYALPRHTISHRTGMLQKVFPLTQIKWEWNPYSVLYFDQPVLD